MSEVITFNTEEAAKSSYTKVQSVDIFALVPENDKILSEVMPEFDFFNPTINPNEFASTLVETCKIKGGFGLSANQCGYRHRVFVMGSGEEYVAFFNPEIVEILDEEEVMEIEGCLSFPGLGLKINRPKSILVSYFDFNNEFHTKRFDGLSARVFLHELDHLNGITFNKRAKPMALKMGEKKRNKFVKLITRYEKANKKIKTLTK